MAIRFRKPDGKEFVTDFCDPKLNFLAHAQAVECDLGSECGGHGICGQDRIRFVSASKSEPSVSPETEEEERLISSRERKQGWRLACQVFPEVPDQDIIVEVLSARSSSA